MNEFRSAPKKREVGESTRERVKAGLACPGRLSFGAERARASGRNYRFGCAVWRRLARVAYSEVPASQPAVEASGSLTLAGGRLLAEQVCPCPTPAAKVKRSQLPLLLLLLLRACRLQRFSCCIGSSRQRRSDPFSFSSSSSITTTAPAPASPCPAEHSYRNVACRLAHLTVCVCVCVCAFGSPRRTNQPTCRRRAPTAPQADGSSPEALARVFVLCVR